MIKKNQNRTEKKDRIAFDDSKIEEFQKEIIKRAKNKQYEHVEDNFFDYLKRIKIGKDSK